MDAEVGVDGGGGGTASAEVMSSTDYFRQQYVATLCHWVTVGSYVASSRLRVGIINNCWLYSYKIMPVSDKKYIYYDITITAS